MLLYGYFRSSAAYRVRIALNLKGLAYDNRFIHLQKNDQLSGDYAKLNPQKLVPTLVDGDRMLTQSLAIMEYLDETHPDPPFLPPAPADNGCSWNMFCVLLPLERLRITRKQFVDAMHARGIGVGISYEAAHLTTLGRRFGYREGQLPNAERIGRETVTLPLFADMTAADVERVCAAVADILAGQAR